MMDVRSELHKLGEPDVTAVERVWTRFEHSRRPRRKAAWAIGAGLTALVGAGLVAAVFAMPEASRSLQLEALVSPMAHTWSDQVRLDVHGRGEVSGTSRDVRIDWQSGTVGIEVAPHTGTRLAVLTDEARVDVIGTVLSVRRDALGVTVEVERGRVAVTCKDGWRGEIGPGDPAHTCLPISPAGWLGRADALIDAGDRGDDLLVSLDRGVAAARPGSPVQGELLVRRMRARAEGGEVDGALADAGRYLEADAAGRAVEVRRFAGWLALTERGCDAAMPWLSALQQAGSPEESVLIAECVAPTEPERARRLLLGALPALDASWSERATHDLGALMMETR